MASFVPQSTQGRPPSGMIGRRPPTGYNPGAGARPPTNFVPGRGARPPTNFSPSGQGGAPGAINPYRNQKAITPELLAQMARRRLGG